MKKKPLTAIGRMLEDFKVGDLTHEEMEVFAEHTFARRAYEAADEKLDKLLNKKFKPRIAAAKSLEDFLDIKARLAYAPRCAGVTLLYHYLFGEAGKVLSKEDAKTVETHAGKKLNQ